MGLISNNKILFYDIHDGKMLYLLTQHSLFNHRHHPFILCTCKRGEGLNDSDHNCRLMTHGEQVTAWELVKTMGQKRKKMEWITCDVQLQEE